MQTIERRSGQDRRSQTAPHRGPERRQTGERRSTTREVWEAPAPGLDAPLPLELRPAGGGDDSAFPPIELPEQTPGSPQTPSPPEER